MTVSHAGSLLGLLCLLGLVVAVVFAVWLVRQLQDYDDGEEPW